MLTEEQLQDIFELADLLSNGDRDLFMQLREIVFSNDPNYILDMVEKMLDAPTFDAFLARVEESEKENLWLILLTVLEHHNYLFISNPEDNLKTFIRAFDCIPQVRATGISLQLNWDGLNPMATVPEWAAVIDDKFAGEDYCLGSIAMNSGDYYLFFSKKSVFLRIQHLSQKLGYRVDYARYM